MTFRVRPARYNAKHEPLDKPHDLGVVTMERKTWYYELATSAVWLWDEISGAINCFVTNVMIFRSCSNGQVGTLFDDQLY